MKAPVSLFCAALIVAAGVSAARADSTATPQALPPGMTPAVWKMINTTGPKNPPGLPTNLGLEPVAGCIPTMGYHYAKPKNLPFGPIYGWYQGQATFTEVMVAKSDFTTGKSWNDLMKPLPGYKIDHVDIWFEAHGHPGYLVPHYDIHAWYIPHDKHMTFCGNTSGTKPAWLGS